jgi:3-carboxy-cis,cis-muconate cycloisomerase
MRHRSSTSEMVPEMSALWDPIFGADRVASVTGARAWLQALCDVEAGLARACARTGLIDADAAAKVVAACSEVAKTDPADLGRLAVADGNPVIPLVKELRRHVPDAPSAVHFGATSQDILDTAGMVVAKQALTVVLSALVEAADGCATLATAHRDTPMSGRTLLQQALPTTFGALVAVWGEGLDRSIEKLLTVQADLAVQLGGAAGTLAAWHPNGPAVRAAFADEVSLADPGTVWHTERTRIAELAGALGLACGVIGKIATDVVLLAQTELGEVHEQLGGASSAMPHKQNPIAAVTARAAAAQAPGLVATLFAAMPAELQRGAGPWHAEWHPLISLLKCTGGAAERISVSLAGLLVDPAAMSRNLQHLLDLVEQVRPKTDVGHAADLVDHYLNGRHR